ncbi:MAG TPA: heme ABC exporter ATP-binding protein CcmA [Actinomycetota bacterium]|nr:heme ABC exporter ATP-binding protein CcmA [Actinomycetota bacterium]
MIDVHSLGVAFGRTLALHEVDAHIDPGIHGLFGPNGSGKSTLLRVLAGLLRPTRGHVSLEGRVVSIKDEALRGRIGYVGHRSGLYARLSVMENLRLFAHLHGRDGRRCELMAEQLGLWDRRDTPAATLSAGFRRRAAVARALLTEPDVLLLDEPYANLDDDAAELVTQAVIAWRTPGRVAVIATHGAKKVKAYADGGMILQHGRLIRQGRYEASGFTV